MTGRKARTGSFQTGEAYSRNSVSSYFMPVTQQDIAKHLGISAKSVARALNGQGKVSATTRAQVLAVAKELGYDAAANLDARNLVARRTGKRVLRGTIAIAGMDLLWNYMYWSRTLRGVQEALAGTALDILFLPGDEVPRWEKFDGLLVFGNYPREIVAARPSTMAAVTSARPVPGLPCVSADERSAGYLATRHLLALGHRNIGCLMWPTEREADLRIQGYYDAYLEAGLDTNPRWVRPLHFVTGGQDFPGANIREWLADGWDTDGITAILVQNDSFAAAVMYALQDAGYSVPRHVSVVGFDSTEVCDLMRPALTSIQIPFVDIGWRAMELLTEQMEDMELWTRKQRDSGSIEPEMELLPVEINIRRSTAPPRS